MNMLLSAWLSSSGSTTAPQNSQKDTSAFMPQPQFGHLVKGTAWPSVVVMAGPIAVEAKLTITEPI
jgi:hypothetical protein